MTLASLVPDAARRMPDACAIEDPEGRSLTYAEFDALTTRMAHVLHEAGVRRGDRVGICLPKSINSVVCIMGALKAGAAYVPVDYSAPAERNRYIFDNCQTKVVCTDEPRSARLHEAWTDPPPLLVFPDNGPDGIGADWLDAGSPDWTNDDPAGPDDLSYILYTSGSTGVPKGVMHTHASALSFVQWGAEAFEPRGQDRFSSHAPFHFDLSILDLYVPQTAGAALVIVNEDLGKEPHQLAPFIASSGITVWYSVPSILTMLAQFGNLPEHDFSALRAVLFAGEVFPVKHLRALKELWPDKAYFNLYGPTETNVCTYHQIPDVLEPEREIPYPIGKATSNVRALVLDENNEPVSGGDEGVLYIHQSGPVMKGYWAMEERTAESMYTDSDGEQWYCTGDVVSTDEAGDFIFVGRRDRMVKRRGYRIELGEVEAGLYTHGDVEECAAIAKESDEGVTIFGFLCPKEGRKLSIIQLKGFCMQNLPAYMVPDRFVFLDKLPRTSTDKVDYQGLLREHT